MSAGRRIAFVVHRHTATTFGGAERLAFAFAKHAGTWAATELITTTAHDYMTWENAEAPGISESDGVVVRRFSVDVPRDVAAFDRASRRLVRARAPSLADQERWIGRQGPLSLDLLRYLAVDGPAYDAVFFVSYLYATTYFGLPLVAPRAVLLPLAHDEWMIRFSMWDRIFGLPRTIVYSSEEERAFVAGRFAGTDVDGPVIGGGIDAPLPGDAERFRARFGIDRPFALYVGRVDPSKGCAALLRDYARYRRTHPGGRELVLAGELQMELPPQDGVRYIGTVDEATKWDALAASDVLVLPSAYESLSLAVLEAWSAHRPVLVNARSAVLVGQCLRSGGGRAYANAGEFAAALDALDASTSRELGARGAAYVRERYDWAGVNERLRAHLATTFDWPEERRG